MTDLDLEVLRIAVGTKAREMGAEALAIAIESGTAGPEELYALAALEIADFLPELSFGEDAEAVSEAIAFLAYQAGALSILQQIEVPMAAEPEPTPDRYRLARWAGLYVLVVATACFVSAVHAYLLLVLL